MRCARARRRCARGMDASWGAPRAPEKDVIWGRTACARTGGRKERAGCLLSIPPFCGPLRLDERYKTGDDLIIVFVVVIVVVVPEVFVIIFFQIEILLFFIEVFFFLF